MKKNKKKKQNKEVEQKKNNNNNNNNNNMALPIDAPSVGFGLADDVEGVDDDAGLREAASSWTPPGISAPLHRAYALCVERRLEEGDQIGEERMVG